MDSCVQAPFYYDNIYYVIRVHTRDYVGHLYLEEKRSPVSLSNARQFSSANNARRSLARLPKGGRLYEVETLVEKIGPIHVYPDAIMELLKRIPPPYVFTAMGWMKGEDIRIYRSASTYLSAPQKTAGIWY